jgi:hypothetical protein
MKTTGSCDEKTGAKISRKYTFKPDDKYKNNLRIVPNTTEHVDEGCIVS